MRTDKKKKGLVSKLKTYRKIGSITMILGFTLFGLLLISPYVPNYIGRAWDERVYNQALENIETHRKGTITIQLVDGDNNPLPGVNLDVNLTNHEFLFGAMFFHYDTPNESATYAGLWTKIFNFAILPFYYSMWNASGVNPEEDRINRTIEYCHEKNIPMKGHPLVWNIKYGIPEWLSLEEMTPVEIEEHFRERIFNTTQKYRSNITYWDVTNEFVTRGAPGGLDTEDFLHKCLTWAREAVPENKLTINEYSVMGHDFGYGDPARMYKKLEKRGTPYDILGFQTHAMDTDWVPTYEIWGSLDGYSQFNKPIHITEFMVPSSGAPITNSWKKGVWSEAHQAEYIRRVYTAAFGHLQCESILYWGFEDGTLNPLKNEGYGLVSSDFQPKLSYKTLNSLINGDWHTELSDQITDTAGEIEFRGFYGTYNVTIGGQIYKISAEQGGSNTFRIHIP